MQYVLQEMELEALPSRLCEPVVVRCKPENGSMQVSVGPVVGSKLPFVQSMVLDLGEEGLHLQTSQAPFTLGVPAPAAAAHKISLKAELYLQKWCTRPTWPIALEVSTQEGAEHTVQVEYYLQPFAKTMCNMRAAELLVERQDDPEMAFKRRKKKEAKVQAETKAEVKGEAEEETR